MKKSVYYKNLTNKEVAILTCYKILGWKTPYTTIAKYTGLSIATISNTLNKLRSEKNNVLKEVNKL